MLARWAESASLADLVYLLRHDDAELGPAGPTLARAALSRAAAQRRALRARLAQRLLRMKPGDGEARRVLEADPSTATRVALRPDASVFRVGAILPQSGDYEVHGRSLKEGLEIALREFEEVTRMHIDVRAPDSHGDRPALAAREADTLARQCGALVGELLSPSTFAVASFAMGAGVPVLSPIAPDESVGEVGPWIVQVGPSGYQRGQRLARTVVAPGSATRIALLWSDAEEQDPFVLGFRAAAESLGAQIVWEGRYPAQISDLRTPIRALKRRDPQVLMWNGEPREAESLVRQLVSEKVTITLCGSAGLDPAQVHAETKALLEGVVFVGEDWKLAGPRQTALDAGVAAFKDGPTNRLHVRGYLAGRAIAGALAEGALCPEELGDALRREVASEPYLFARGFLRGSPADGTIAVYRVEHGVATLLPEATTP